MIRFHEIRTTQKISSIEALRIAQIDMLNSPEKRLQAPYFWAGYMAIGGQTTY
jgi:CHAT domain-containing protein